MVRPLAERDREYVRRPLNAVLGAPSHIAVFGYGALDQAILILVGEDFSIESQPPAG